MKIAIDLKRLKFFLWAGLAYTLAWVIHDWISNADTFIHRAVNEIWRGTYLTAINYLFFEYILKRLGWKKPLTSFLLLLTQVFLYSFGLYFWREAGIAAHVWTEYITYSSLSENVFNQFSNGIFSFVFFAVLRLGYGHIQLTQATQQLRIEKQQAELNYLKAQTNPHFLFNTLNNIYALAKEKSDLAPESILRLSKILRFMLYETSGGYIAIEEEIKIIGDYIALEKLRYDESLHVTFNYEVDDMKQPLPPLLLIPLVENAFKHGVSETRHKPFVNVDLISKKNHLVYIVRNSSDELPAGNIVKENIGLSNLRRQLELLYSDYTLSFQKGEYGFTARLTINLASHV